MISSEIVIAYTQCRRKAYHLLLSTNKPGACHEYITIVEKETLKNRTEYFRRLKSMMPEMLAYSPALLAKGIPALYEANLHFEDLTAYIDVLTKSEEISTPRKPHYVPTLVIGKHKINKEHKLHLAFNAYVLSAFQKEKPSIGILIDRRGKKHTIPLSPLYKEIAQIIDKLRGWVSAQKQEIPSAILNRNCPYCFFQHECESEAEKQDHLSLLGGMREKEVINWNKKGIFTVTQLSYTYRPRKRKKGKKFRSRYYHSLKALAIREQRIYIANKWTISEAKTHVFLDVEGLPDQDFYYLIGLVVIENTNTNHFSFWANSRDEEEKIWRSFLSVMTNYQDFTVFHYGSYETTFLKRMNNRYGGQEDEEFIAKISSNMVNLLSLIYANIYFPTYSNSLKDIGRYLGQEWSEENATGLQSIVWRYHWENGHKNELKKKLQQYNLEDCSALVKILEAITKIIQGDTQYELESIDDIRPEANYSFGKVDFMLDDLELINKCSYFDYQREKIYFRTDKKVRKALKKQEKRNRIINQTNGSFNLTPEFCPNCHHTKFRQLTHKTKTIVDLKFIKNGIKKWALECHGGRFQCLKCKHSFSPKDLKTVPRCGNNLMIWSMNQYVQYGITLENLTEVLLDSFNIEVSLSEMFYFKRKLAEQYMIAHEEIRQSLVSGELLHVDETEARLRNKGEGYVWVFTNMTSVLYMFRPTREADFLKEYLKDFTGVLISDFYSGYDSLPCPQQKCLVHLIRDLNQDLFKNQLDFEYKRIVVHFGCLLKAIVETIDTYGLKRRYLQKHKKDVDAFYNAILTQEYTSELAIAYQNRFKKTQGKLFTFLDYDGIPWNNNNAEHSIKPFSRYRRKVNKSYTERSLGFYLILLSIQQTCKYRGINFLDFLKSGEKSIEEYSKRH